MITLEDYTPDKQIVKYREIAIAYEKFVKLRNKNRMELIEMCRLYHLNNEYIVTAGKYCKYDILGE